jgi:hypothetical protein
MNREEQYPSKTTYLSNHCLGPGLYFDRSTAQPNETKTPTEKMAFHFD